LRVVSRETTRRGAARFGVRQLHEAFTGGPDDGSGLERLGQQDADDVAAASVGVLAELVELLYAGLG